MAYNNKSAVKSKLFGDYIEIFVDATNTAEIYVLYQDFTNPKEVLISKNIITAVGGSVEFHKKTCKTTTEVSTLWSTRLTLTYYNLIDVDKNR